MCALNYKEEEFLSVFEETALKKKKKNIHGFGTIIVLICVAFHGQSGT